MGIIARGSEYLFPYNIKLIKHIKSYGWFREWGIYCKCVQPFQTYITITETALSLIKRKESWDLYCPRRTESQSFKRKPFFYPPRFAWIFLCYGQINRVARTCSSSICLIAILHFPAQRIAIRSLLVLLYYWKLYQSQ